MHQFSISDFIDFIENNLDEEHFLLKEVDYFPLKHHWNEDGLNISPKEMVYFSTPVIPTPPKFSLDEFLKINEQVKYGWSSLAVTPLIACVDLSTIMFPPRAFGDMQLDRYIIMQIIANIDDEFCLTKIALVSKSFYIIVAQAWKLIFQRSKFRVSKFALANPNEDKRRWDWSSYFKLCKSDEGVQNLLRMDSLLNEIKSQYHVHLSSKKTHFK